MQDDFAVLGCPTIITVFDISRSVCRTDNILTIAWGSLRVAIRTPISDIIGIALHSQATTVESVCPFDNEDAECIWDSRIEVCVDICEVTAEYFNILTIL